MRVSKPFLFLIALTLAGCAAAERPLNETGFVSISVDNTTPVNVAWISVYQMGRDLDVTGAVEPLWSQDEFWFGHFDIKAETPGGETAEATNVRMKRQRLPAGAQNRNRRAAFHLRLDLVAEPGTRIDVAYHRDPHA